MDLNARVDVNSGRKDGLAENRTPILRLAKADTTKIQIFNGSNPDYSFTLAVSNSFLSPLKKIPWLQIWEKFRVIFFSIQKMVCCVHSLE